MIHHAARSFWACYEGLPEAVRTLADKQFQLLKANPQHPSLHFRPIGSVHSVRVGMHYRALAVEVKDGIFGSGTERIRSMIGLSVRGDGRARASARGPEESAARA